jgi:hypothetical protein
MKQRVRIIAETDPLNPRRDYDNLGSMVCWHPRYTLGDEQISRDNAQETYDALPETAEVLPLFLYEHGGITMNTNGFSCPWDSGQVGFIYVTAEEMIKEYGDDSEETRENVRNYLKGEVELYDMYLRGDVYGFVIEEVSTCDHGHEHATEVDSCWGFFGSEPEENGMLDYIPDELHEQAKRWDVEYR